MDKFTHFRKEAVTFYEDIKKNNNKEWFEENRPIYQKYVIDYAKGFVVEMGERLQKLVPDINYSPKINGSIFKIFNDVRFHKGAPLKTHLGIFFWEGSQRMGSSGFYFHLEPPFYTAGVGIASFDKDLLGEYRKAILNEKEFKEFEKIMNEMKSYHFKINGEKRKTLPRGLSGTPAQNEYLMYNSLYIGDETPINADFYKDGFLDGVFENFKKMLPYHIWLTKLIKRVHEKRNKETM